MTSPSNAPARALDVVLSLLLLVVALPLMGVLALAVRLGSHGSVLHRETARSRRGGTYERLHFRTTPDGASSAAHARIRAVVSGEQRVPPTSVGRLLEATRTDRLPALFNVLAGDTGWFDRPRPERPTAVAEPSAR